MTYLQTPPATIGQTTITEAEYGKFCEYLYRRTGISVGDNKRYFVDKRVLERMAKTGCNNFAAYFDLLRRHDSSGEIEQLINLFTVNETYFYREDYQFDCLVNGILPELVATRRKGDRIRIWTMPCSTGEEPYSIAIYLLENWRLVDDYDIEIVASDIDTNVLRTAEAGLYDPRSLHRLSRDVVGRYFQPAGGDRFRLIDAVRQSVSFAQVNASDAVAMRAYSDFDVIFCRNMLIYFDKATQQGVLTRLCNHLRPGGYLFLGHSETLAGFGLPLKPVGNTVFQRE